MKNIDKIAPSVKGQRDLSIDNLKGLAIFLVVVGHLLQNSIADFDHNIVFRIIYSFHMPLFFFLSGYVCFLTKDFRNSLLKKRFLSLILPFITWAIFTFYLKNIDGNLLKYLSDVVCRPDKGLWFLWVLFFCYVLIYIAFKIPMKIEIILTLIGIGLIIIGITINANIFGLKVLAMEFPFFTLGYIFHKFKDPFLSLCKRYWTFSFFLFIITVPFWMRTEPPLFYQYINLGFLFSFAFSFFVSVFGVFSIFAIFQFNKNNTKFKILSFIGQHSLSIYIIHFFFLDFFHLFNWNEIYYFNVILYAAFLVIICLLIDYLLSMNRILAFVFLGRSMKG